MRRVEPGAQLAVTLTSDVDLVHGVVPLGQRAPGAVVLGELALGHLALDVLQELLLQVQGRGGLGGGSGRVGGLRDVYTCIGVVGQVGVCCHGWDCVSIQG